MSNAPSAIVQASPLPVIVSAASLVASIGVYFLALGIHSELMFVVGYLLTPFITTMSLGWDALLQMKGKINPWFNGKPAFGRILQVLAVLGLMVGSLHIIQLGLWIGAQAVQNGWVK